MLSRLVFYLALTWAVECMIALGLLRLCRHERGKLDLSLLRDTFLVNALTNPLANYAGLAWGANFWLTEAVVFIVEIPLYRTVLQLNWRQAALLSLIANGVTLSLSFVV